MQPERWRKIEEIYTAALERDADDRATFLREACGGDEALQQEVQSLLAQEVAGNFMESSAFQVAAKALAREHVQNGLSRDRMIGRTISHYCVLEKLAEGGMGVVYKARDTRLDRLVAIKALPLERIADPERKRRFVHEAKLASSLNHPNIIHIYDIDTSEGADFIAMEFVSGRTLGQMIGRKGLPLNAALRISIQIADALARAHAAGIVHRDLKPSNVMVTESGLVKVLDFGLAKLSEEAANELASPETHEPATEEGTVIGTVGYMSPEQIEGKKVDARSDIFSFGAMLYEMITGRRAFQAESKAVTLAAVLQQDPEPISAILENAPQELEKLIARCLRKNPEYRAQHMADVRVALEELKEESDSGKLPASALRHQRLPRWAIAMMAFVAVVGVGIAWWLTRSPKPATLPTLTRLTWDSGLTTDPALSPDGKLLAYASDRAGEGNLDIYVRQVGGGEPLRLTHDPADEHEPAFSPDGTTITFRSEQEGGGIYVVSALGGPARRIAPEGRRPQFSPDGKWIAYSVGGLGGPSLNIRDGCRIYVVPSEGGAPRRLRSDFAAAVFPSWSPDGTHLLFLGNSDQKLPPEEAIDWWVTPLDSGPAIKTGALEATRNANLSGPAEVYPWALVAPTWDPQGDSLVFSARSGDSTNLWRIGISPKAWKVSGPPQRLTSGPTLEEDPSVVSGASGTTRVAFASLGGNVNIWSLPIDANQGKVVGELQQLTHDSAADFHPALSPDGRKMVFISSRSGNEEVWVKDLRTGEDSALTASRSNKWLPLFSPDGGKVSFTSYENKRGNYDGYIIPTAGGAPEMLCEDCGEATDWSSDGRRIVGNTVDGRAWLLDVASRRKTALLAPTAHWIATDKFSPDDRWIAFVDITSGHDYIAPAAEAPIPQSAWIDIMDGEAKGWSPDGKMVYVYSFRDGYGCIWAQRLDPARKRPIGAPFAVFHSHNARRSLANQDDLEMFVSRDKMVFSMGERTGNIWMAEWKER